MKKNNYLSLGVMSGTSCDGIDLSLIQTDGKDRADFISSMYIKYSDELKEDLFKLINNFTESSLYSSKVIEIQEKVTIAFINAIENFYKKTSKRIDLISIHGQSIFHNPSKKISIQLCNAELIKTKFNIKVVYDFRQNDISNGGQGAPLTPIFHKLINKKFKLNGVNAYLNIGGVSNITLIRKNQIISAFDTGPGMGILNDYVFFKKKIFYDKDGTDSMVGIVQHDIVKSLLKDKFFKLKPPKSLDKNYFDKTKFMNLKYNDSCASIVEFTVDAIKKGIFDNKFKIDNLILMGGGIKNKCLFKRIKDKININIINIKSFGIDEDFIEAQAFAYLGVRRLKNLPLTYPQTTGVSKPVTGGKII